MTDDRPTPPAYTDRIRRVSAFILDHLDEPLPLERLAEVACFSPYHFHRIYRGAQGETTDQTVRRLRLHRAATALLRGDTPLAAIAKAAGYGSGEAFSRAFSAAYGRSPTQYRGGGPNAAPTTAQEIAVTLTVDIQETPALMLEGAPHRGDYFAISGVFERVFSRLGAAGRIGVGVRSIGVYYDDPMAVPAADLRSFAGVVVDPNSAADPELERVALAGGRHAVTIHVGPYAELERTYAALYSAWLPESGHEAADQPAFEEYLNDPRQTPPTELRTAIYLPLAA